MRHTKFEVPELSPPLVERAEVRRALDAAGASGPSGRVLLVSAPAGHGKTVAVADWVRSTDEVPTAWVTLDAADRAEHRWWRTVLDGIRACAGQAGDTAPDHAVGLQEPTARGEFLTSVLEVLDGLPAPLRLVVDDTHEIVGHPAQRALRDLVRHPVRGLTIVLCGRVDPPIGLDRLRLAGRLGELRVDRLAFTVEDATRLFEQAALDLDPDQVATLVERTEGWAAALRLVSRSLQGAADRASVVADFAGDDRSVADYVVDEVLSTLDDRERTVLEVAGACSPVPVDLARALTGDPRAGETLDRLEATTGMVTAIDRRREHYHAHELLRSHIVARMRRTRWSRLDALYRRAATWHEEHDDAAAALRFCALAEDVAGTAALLRTAGTRLLATGRLASLRDTERVLEPDGTDVHIRLVMAMAALETGDPAGAAETFDGIRWPGSLPPGVSTLRGAVTARLALAADDPAAARAAAARWIRPESVDETALRALALTTRAYVRATVDPDGAALDAQTALGPALRHDWPFLVTQARAALARAHVHGHRLDAAVEQAHRVLGLTGHHGWEHTPWPAVALAVLGLADVLAGRPEHALADVARARTEAPDHDAVVGNALAVVRGAAEYDSGREIEGWQLLRAARVRAAARHYDDRQLAVAALLGQRAALGLGRVREVGDVARAVAAALPTPGDAALLRARDRWVTARDPAARRLLAPVTEIDRTPLAAAESPVLDAEMALAAGQQAVARRRMLDALRHADADGILRPLLHAPPELHEFLERRRGSFGELDPLVARVLTAARHVPNRPVAGLTEREREVLELLPMMRSVAEIADDLAVSVNTVKTHQRAIYHKLGAGSRRDAVVRARRLGLLVSSG